MKRSGSAVWQGGLKDGKGAVSTESGVLDATPYSFSKRFGDEKGTNPEELLGAAHAACFTMALSNVLGEAGFKADELSTNAVVTIQQDDSGFTIPTVDLTLKAKIPGITEEAFQEAAGKAKSGCPVSKLFTAEISLDAQLVS